MSGARSQTRHMLLWATMAVTMAAAVLLPMPLVLAPHPLIVLSYALVFAIACMGLNLVFGTTGPPVARARHVLRRRRLRRPRGRGVEDVASSWTRYHNMALGVLLIAVVFAFPRGVAGSVAALIERMRRPRPD